MIINYKKNELKDNEKFNIMYDFLTRHNCYIVAGNKDIDGNANFSDLWSRIKCDSVYINYRHYGSSAIKKNKAGFKWLITTIFDDCNTFTAIDSETYNTLYINSLINKKIWRI